MGSDTDDAIELRVGERHSVPLPGLGTAGYRWVPEVEGDPEVAEVRRSSASAPDPDAAVGASADELFVIQANRPGTARIRFAQRRPWEPAETQPAEQHTISLRVT